MEAVFHALRDQRDEFEGILSGLDEAAWATPTPRCPGWTVADVVTHLAQTDELATSSAEGRWEGFLPAGDAAVGAKNVDDAAEAAVASERGVPARELLARWRTAAAAQFESLASCSPDRRLPWVIGELPVRTLATTRLSECWIHTGDIADAVGISLAPTDRLWHIARLAWRTLPYAFDRAGRALSGPVEVRLTAPDGSTWQFAPEGAAATTVVGPAHDFCLVAGRRLDPTESALEATGADTSAVLELVRTFA